jgi:PAS domain S-box-containing protein
MRSSMGKYAGALASVALSLGLRLALNPVLGARYPLLLVAIAIIISARYFGAAPAALAMVLGAVGSTLLIGDHNLGPNSDSTGLLSYFVGLTFTILMMEALRRARRRADERLTQLHTEVARREQEQRLSAQLRAIVESSNDAIFSHDLDHNIVSWNGAATRIFGYTAEEALGTPISILTPAERSNEELEWIALVQTGHHVQPCDTVRLHKDGSLVQVAVSISPIYDGNGGLAGASYIARDIAERIAVEQRLLQSQKLESLGVLAGGLAHDFNNLLTGIMGNAGLAYQMETSASVKGRIGEVLHASERAALLIRQMLAYAGKGVFVVERVDLSQLVREVIPLVSHSFSRDIEVHLQLAEGLPSLESDRSQMQQMVMNLVLNAAEAIGEGHGAVTVVTALTISSQERRVLLEVTDDGCGMSTDIQARIFDPFFTTKFTGRGLGLAAALGIVRAHRGEITVDSAPGRGSVFSVFFPVLEENSGGDIGFPA